MFHNYLSYFSVVVINHFDQEQLNGAGVSYYYHAIYLHFQVIIIIERNQGRHSNLEAGRGWTLLLAHSLAHSGFACFFIAQDNIPRNHSTYSGLGPPTLMSNQDNDPQRCPWAYATLVNPQPVLLLHGLYYIKLINLILSGYSYIIIAQLSQ